MSVLIKGVEMPEKKNGAVLIIYPDGRCALENGKEYKAVPVPPHGRLIDADELKTKYFCGENVEHDKIRVTVDNVLHFIDNAPTVIEAESYSERELQRDYEASVEYAQHCGRYEPTYNPDTGAM